MRAINPKVTIETFDYALKSKKQLTGPLELIRRRIPLRFSPKTDSFQPLEKEKGVALKIIEYLSDIDYPVVYTSKSDLTISPEYFKAITANDNIIYQATIINMQRKVAQMMETNSPSPLTRMKVLRTFKGVGIKTVIRLMPMYPKISSGAAAMHVVNSAVDNVDGILSEEGCMMNPTHGKQMTQHIRNFARKHGLKEYTFYDMTQAILNTGEHCRSVLGSDVDDFWEKQKMRTGGARKISFGGMNCATAWSFAEHLALKQRCRELGLEHNIDLPEHHTFCDNYFCCGVGKTKGFESVNSMTIRGWTRDVQRFGHIAERDAFRYDALSGGHLKSMTTIWNENGLSKIIGIKKDRMNGEKVFRVNRDDALMVEMRKTYGNKIDEWYDCWRKTDVSNPDKFIM